MATDTNEHPYAIVLQWVAQGLPVQVYINGVWRTQTPFNVLNFIQQSPGLQAFRLRPETFTVPESVVGLEWQAPIGPGEILQEGRPRVPDEGTYVYLPRIDSGGHTSTCVKWSPSAWMLSMLEAGMVHDTKGGAESHTQALIQISKLTTQSNGN